MKGLEPKKELFSLCRELGFTQQELSELDTIFRATPFYLAIQIASYQNKRAAALYQLIQHYIESSLERSPIMFRSPEAVYHYFAPYLAPKMHEELWLAIVDAKLQLRSMFLISQGNQESTKTYPKRILTYLKQCHAKRFFLIHNHPSGDPSPSPEDYTFTKTIQTQARQKGFELVDHIIIGKFHPIEDENLPYYSFTLAEK